MALNVSGVDYAWGSVPFDALKTAGFKFAMRYLSHDASKNLSRGEYDALRKRGIGVGLVWESTGGRARDGHSAGVDDARAARDQASALGLHDIPIYFAVDFDATDADKPQIAAYLRGAASVLGHHRTGVYGSYYVVKYMDQHNACAFFWQTYAWSGGFVYRHAHILQYKNGVNIGGLDCDLDKASLAGMHSIRPQTPGSSTAQKLKAWRAELRRRRVQLRTEKNSGTRHFLIRRINELKALIRRYR